MALTDATKPTDVALNTDLYELTMANGYFLQEQSILIFWPLD